MITADQLAALEAAAQSWVGTPFCEGAPVKGAGVSCHHLVAEIYFEAGLVERITVPDGPSNWRAQSRSLIAEWADACDLLIRLPDTLNPLPGDLLAFRVGPIHHAAIQLGGGRIVHSVVGHGVGIAPQIPAQWAYRLGVIWRLKNIA